MAVVVAVGLSLDKTVSAEIILGRSVCQKKKFEREQHTVCQLFLRYTNLEKTHRMVRSIKKKINHFVIFQQEKRMQDSRTQQTQGSLANLLIVFQPKSKCNRIERFWQNFYVEITFFKLREFFKFARFPPRTQYILSWLWFLTYRGGGSFNLKENKW